MAAAGAQPQTARTAALPPVTEKEELSEKMEGVEDGDDKARFWKRLKCW